jgi:hypothetical protein
MALQWIAALRENGAEVFPFDMSYVHDGDVAKLFRQLPPLTAFDPEMVVSMPTAMHAMRCKTGRVVLDDGRYVPNNLFIDNLKLPTILIWDTMAELFMALGVPMLDPAKSRSGVLADLRTQINDPLCFHCAFDQQHVDTLRALGALTTPQVRVRLATGQPHHVAHGLAAEPDGYDEAVAFTGNLFSPRPPRGQGQQQVVLERLLHRVMALMAADPLASYWESIERALGELDPAERSDAKLSFDESFFWEYLCVDIMSTATTQGRMNALAASRHPVSIYGLMFDPQSTQLLQRHPHLVAKGAADYQTELPRLNRRTKVTLDVVTAHFPTGSTFKVLSCFASGGLCLFNAKPAFAAAFGDAAEHVMFRDYDDMNAKLDRLLSRDRERLELIEHIKAKVHAEHTTIGLLAELVEWVRESRA